MAELKTVQVLEQTSPLMLFCTLFQTLLLSKQTLLKFTAGHLFDLISNDVRRMEEETVKFFFLAVFAVPAYAGAIFIIYIDWLAGCYGCVRPVYSPCHTSLSCPMLMLSCVCAQLQCPISESP